MSEEEIINQVKDIKADREYFAKNYEEDDNIFKRDIKALQGILDLYLKEKERNKELKRENKQIKENLKTTPKIQTKYLAISNRKDVKKALNLIAKETKKYMRKDKIRKIISKYVNINEHLEYYNQELYGRELADMIKELLEK